MNLASRILGVAIFFALIAGATFGAFQAYDRAPGFSQVEMSTSSTPSALIAGGSTDLRVGLQNTGDTAQNLTIEAATEGFTFRNQRAVIPLSAGATTNAQGRLAAERGLQGSHNVTLQALDQDGNRIATTGVPVTVIQGGLGTASLDANLPAGIPGGEVTFQVTVQNPVAAEQRVNLTLDDPTQGTITPQQLTIGANSSSSARVTIPIASDASGTLGIGLTATSEAGDATRAQSSLPILAEGEIAVAPVTPQLAVEPGNRYAVPVLVLSNLASEADVAASGDNILTTNFTSVPSGEALGGFVTLRAPANASGTFTQTVDITVGDQTRSIQLRIDTDVSGTEAGPGTEVRVDYVGRLVSGEVFDSSRPEVANGPFPKSQSFQLRQGLEPITVPLNPNRPGVIQGFYDALVDMRAGETKSVILSPSEAYGPPRNHQNLSATTELDREQTSQRQLDNIPRRQLPGSFDIANKTEGDILTFETPVGGETVTFEFRLDRKGTQTVDLTRMAEVGDTTTFYPAWPNATEVVAVNETHITYDTTPPEDAGAFTWDTNPSSHQAQWTNATTVRSVNETTIVLQHAPEEGLTYQASTNPRAPPTTYTVEAVGSDEIHVSSPNNHPLAGETLIFDLTLIEVSPLQQQPIQIGGG